MCGVTTVMYIFHTDIQHATYVLVIVWLPDEATIRSRNMQERKNCAVK